MSSAASQLELPRSAPAPEGPEGLLARAGLRDFRAGQREVVQAALEGRDSLVVMPTGGGKSLCYQLPAAAGIGLVVVMSPLIALMEDQLRRLESMGVRGVMLASTLEPQQNREALARIASGEAQLVLAAPERFVSEAFRNTLRRRGVALFVVDEAHCVSEWGHDFRPDYLRLGEEIEALGRPTVMAATATATRQVAREIAARLGLRDYLEVRAGFDRPNLSFDVVALEGRGTQARKERMVVDALAGADARPAIVYCGTRKDTDQVWALLREHGVAAVRYHAGMEAEERQRSQMAFMTGGAEVVVATNAFGMGVDKADVRTVVHWALPSSVEEYYQEAGRAGRDGEPARALLLAARVDLGRLIHFNTRTERAASAIARRRGWESYRAIERFVSSAACRRRALLDHFGDRAPAAPAGRCCDVCHPDPQLRATIAAPPPRPLRPPRSTTSTTSATGPPRAAARPLTPDEQAAFERLRAWRRERAAGKPAYTVANDATLTELLRLRPASLDELLEVRGVGPAFCERHGQSLLALLGTL